MHGMPSDAIILPIQFATSSPTLTYFWCLLAHGNNIVASWVLWQMLPWSLLSLLPFHLHGYPSYVLHSYDDDILICLVPLLMLSHFPSTLLPLLHLHWHSSCIKLVYMMICLHDIVLLHMQLCLLSTLWSLCLCQFDSSGKMTMWQPYFM